MHKLTTLRRQKKIWIAWEFHRRTIEICNYFSIKLFIFDDNYHRIFRHSINTFKTFIILWKEKPTVLYIQNPSVLLALICSSLRKLLPYFLIVDTHNAAVEPDKLLLKKIYSINKFIQRNSDLTIVTNEALSEIIRQNNGKPFILPDKIPTPQKSKSLNLRGSFNVVYICTFASDEPYLEVFKVAQHLPDDIYIYVTGNCPIKLKKSIESKNSNIIITGFLSTPSYWNLLTASDVAIDLTYRENCLVCGAYESVSVGTPVILSDTQALRKYFYKGAIFTHNNRNDILKAIINSKKYLDKYKKEITELKHELNKTWYLQAEKLECLISTYRHHTHV